MEELLHRVVISERQGVAASGVTEVLGFDENTVALKTGLGLLTLQGSDLKLVRLTPEGGDISITGHICALFYEEPKKDSWLRRLLP